MKRAVLIVIFVLSVTYDTEGVNKYSAAANKPKDDALAQLPTSLRELDKPFRMAKLNLLWTKAKHVRISETCLKHFGIRR